MYGYGTDPGQTLGSVALRYRRRRCARGWQPAVHRGICRVLPMAESERDAPIGGGPTARTARLTRLEALLFLARQPLGSRRLAELAGLADGTKARTLVRELNKFYDTEGSAFRVEEVAGGFQLMSRPKFASWLRRLHSTPVEVRLSAPAMETLAVVAYRQPVLRAEIEAVRGVQCGEILRQLIERDLVRIAGRSEELGRPFLYGTTRRFLEVFGLRHLDELPRAELFRAAEPVPENPDGDPDQISPADTQTSSEPNHFHDSEEETNVKTLTANQTVEEEIAGQTPTAVIEPERNEQPDGETPFGDFQDDFEDEEDDDEDDDYDEDEEDDEDEEEEDDDFDDAPWEEVGDDDEEEEEEEEYEEEEWEDGEDWDEDEDEDEDEENWGDEG